MEPTSAFLSEEARRAPELQSGLRLFRVGPRGCSALRRSCCVQTRPQTPSHAPRRAAFVMTSFETQWGNDDGKRGRIQAKAACGRRDEGKGTRTTRLGENGECPPGKRRKRRTRRAEPHDESGRAVRKLRVERRIKNGLRMLTQAAVSPQRRRTISASSGKQIPVPRQDAGSDARGSCARSARWRLSDDRCIRGRACRARLLFCRCGGDWRS